MNKNFCSAVYVDYKFKPFRGNGERALHEFLLDEVWSDLADPGEDVSAQRDDLDRDLISCIRYQFPDIDQAYERYKEVGYLLKLAVEKWEVIGAWRE
jgi:hypothetical protein